METKIKKSHMIQQNSFNGISEDLLSHKKLGVYLTEQYCISCTYFQQHKGNFGVCKAITNKKPYDGTIKDNACNGYRIHPELIQKRWNLEHPSIIPKVSIFKLIREGFNESAKKKRQYKHLIKRGKYNWQKQNSEKKYGVLGLPYSQTTIQSKRIKSGYYNHKINHQVMEYALRLTKKEYSNKDIIKQIQKMFGITITSITIDNWNKKFGLIITDNKKKLIPVVKWRSFNYLINHNIVTEIKLSKINMKNCIYCNSPNLKKKGKRVNLNNCLQRFICIDCGRMFTDRKTQFKRMKYPENIIKRGLELFQLRLSTRQIVKTLQVEFPTQKFNSTTVWNWIKKYIPNPEFQINGSHRPEVNQAISRGLKLYFAQKGTTKLIKSDSQ